MNNIFRKILNEGLYKNEDIDKHGFKYLNNVLDDFKNRDFIYKRNEDDEVVELYIKDLKNEKGDSFQKNIDRFKKWLNSDLPINLSDKVGTRNNFIRKSLIDEFKKSFGISFTEIEKKDPTIISTAEQESIQAIFLAARIKGGEYKKIFDDILTNSKSSWDDKCNAIKEKLYNNDLGIILTNDKIDFSNEKNKKVLKKLVNILKIKDLKEFENLSNTEFTIIHPDGLKNTNNDVAELTKVLFGEGIKWEVENQGFKLSLKKDNFIPADLYIIPLNNDKLDRIKSIIKTAGKLDPYSMVGLSNKLMGTGDEDVSEPLIYPISLKMPSNNPKIEKIINSEKKNTIQVGIDNIEFIHFNQTGNSTMGIRYGDKKLVLEFRSKGEKNGVHQLWQCNALNKDNRNAIEGGSAKNYMKFVFRDNMNGSITETDVKEIANVFKGKIGNPYFTEALEKSFRRFFEDDDDYIEDDEKENESSWNDIEKQVLLAVPSDPKVRGESSAKEGNIGLGLFCKKLIENGIKGSGNYNKELSQIVQMSFKMNEIVQDTWKIM
jgi:hypothetical protein